MHSGNAAAMPLVRNEATLSFCHASRSVRITTAILVSNCMIFFPRSFRGAPSELGFTRVQQCRLSKSATADLDGANPESRDSPMCNCTSEVRYAPRNDGSKFYPLASQAQARITHSLPPNL